MSSAVTSPGDGQSKNAPPPGLPPNVVIFSPADPRAAKALLNSRIFTRLAVSAQTEPTKISTALKGATLSEAFCLSHRNVVLVFDGDSSDVAEADRVDSHHEKFRLVALALKEFDISLDVAGCVFDAPDVLQAGFQLDRLSDGAVMVIDLMEGEDDDDDSSSEGSPLSEGEGELEL